MAFQARRGDVATAVRCPIFRTDIGDDQCMEASSVPQNNQRSCCGTGCDSPWRICRFCVLQGTVVRQTNVNQPVAETSIVVDRLNGRCAFHKQHGSETRRGAIPAQPVKAVALPPERWAKPVALPPELERARRPAPERQAPEPPALERPRTPPALASAPAALSSNGVKEVSQVLEVPIARVRPYKGQPREWFDPKGLDGLCRTLKKVGQIMPIIVRRLAPEDRDPDHDWEIVEGERRWRSAQAAGKTTIEVIVRVPGSAGRQYLMSAVANFGRAGHTPRETMRAIKEVMKLFDLNMQEAADVFGNSYGWVQQYLSLENLHEKVWAAMGPKLPERQRLPFTVAKELARYPEAMQLELLAVIREKKMRVTQALHHVRQQAKVAGMVQQGPRKPKPLEAFRILDTSADLWVERVGHYLELDQAHLAGMLKAAPPGGVEALRKKLAQCQDLVAQLLKRLRSLES